MNAVKSVTAFRNTAAGYREYQHYYMLGFEQSGIALERSPSRIGALLRRKAALFGDAHDAFVGQYIVELSDGARVKCAIDAHDHPQIRSEAVRAWADLYFKANRWPSMEYPANVLPIVNGNGLITERRIRHLKALRERPKQFDIVFIARVWGGREHNVRLFEQVARVKGNNKLLALFTESDRKQPQTAEYQRRLDRAGVPWSYGTMPLRRFWSLLAEGRVVVFRAGKHLCIPWRMIDLLAMGACVAYDSVPLPQWPEPLVENTHFCTFGLNRPTNTDAGDEAEYEAIPERLAAILGDRDLRQALSRNAAAYFDEHAAPARVAEYVFRSAAAKPPL